MIGNMYMMRYYISLRGFINYAEQWCMNSFLLYRWPLTPLLQTVRIYDRNVSLLHLWPEFDAVSHWVVTHNEKGKAVKIFNSIFRVLQVHGY